MRKYMNQKQKRSLPSVERSVTQVDAPPWEAYFAQELQASTRTEPRRKDEFTATDAAIRLNMSRNCTKAKLDKDVVAGKLKSRIGRLEDGKPVTFYSIA
jgi:hypothetical protein